MNCNKNEQESIKAGKHPSVRAKARQCYGNAFRVVMHAPEYATATYVEGIAILDDILAIEHGWVERDGEIIDPTLPTDRVRYFAGLRFQGAKGLAEALRIPKPPSTRQDFPIFYRFGWGGFHSPEFRKARDAADAYLNERINAQAASCVPTGESSA